MDAKEDGTIYVIDTHTNTIIDTIATGFVTTNIAHDPINQRMYATGHSSGTVFVIDTITNTVIDTILVGTGSMDIAYDPVNHRMYVTNYSDDTVSHKSLLMYR